MWYGPFYAFGKAAGLAVRAGTARLWSGRGLWDRLSSRSNDRLESRSHKRENRLSRAAVAAAVETGRALMDRPSVRTSLEAALVRMLGSTDGVLRSTAALHETADRVAVVLQEREIVPNKMGVDGLPGSGKSTLAQALADRLGLDWKSLDHENMNAPRDFTQERTIYEHHRLFRTQDIDVFDAIVYVDEPVEVSKARVLKRAKEESRESLIVYVLDYEKLKKIGKLAFDVCEGEPISIPNSSLLMKIRPAGGFRATENIESRLRRAAHDLEGMAKEEMLFLVMYGRPRGGLMAYVLPGAFNDELFQGLLGGMRAYLAQ